MRKASLVVVLGLAVSGLSYAAPEVAEVKGQANGPVQMTDAQMDNVVGGALINAVLVDVVDVRNVQVAVPVNAAVAVGILGAAGAAALQQPGRQTQ